MTKNVNILIAGGRDFSDYRMLTEKVSRAIEIIGCDSITIVSGMAKGADMLGARYAKENSLKLVEFPAQWDVYGKRAGFVRNTQMLEYLRDSEDDCIVIAFWDGQSKGTKHTIETAKNMNIACAVCRY